ncbi:hypothetical protein N657DRAFT_557450, partial [Parathielavia appendiculata]
ARHLSVLKTSSCLDDFVDFIVENPASAIYTKHLSVYHGAWTPQSRINWQLHPLLVGKEGIAIGTRLDQAADKAFCRYKEFIETERQTPLRNYRKKVYRLLQLFPCLSRLTIGHLNKYRWRGIRKPQYAKLIGKIWLLPKLEDNIEEAIQIILPTLNSLPNITHIDLEGTFAPPSWPTQSYKYITSLTINPLLVRESHEEKAIEFLSQFPRLQRLSISLSPARLTCLPLGKLLFPRLIYLKIEN